MILLAASPLSISSFRLIVMMLAKGGGSFLAAVFAEPFDGAADGTTFGAEEEVEPRAERDEEVAVEIGGGDSFDELAAEGSCRPMVGGSEGSSDCSCTGRVTITVSPASLPTPPASARTSRRVTWRSAWSTIACPTAPTTVIGLLFLSLT